MGQLDETRSAIHDAHTDRDAGQHGARFYFERNVRSDRSVDKSFAKSMA